MTVDTPTRVVMVDVKIDSAHFRKNEVIVMFQNSVCWNMFVAILLMTSLTSTIADVNRDEIRQKLQLHWDAIQSVELKGEEYVCDNDWNRKAGTPYF